MSSHFFNQFQGTLEKGVVTLYGKLVVGSTGAVTSGTGKGITNITKESGNGTYTILLDDVYHAFLDMGLSFVHATTGEDLTWQILSVDVASAKTIVIGFTTAGTLANAADGDIVYFRIDLRNSSVTW